MASTIPDPKPDHRLMASTIAGLMVVLLAGAIGAASVLADDELETEIEDLDRTSLALDEQKVVDSLGDDFEDFAGSPENADNLINALRSGEDIVLTTIDPADNVTEIETVIENPAGPMGVGGAFISAAMAEELLAQQGLEPTPENIQAVLFGMAVEVENPEDPENPLIEGFDGVLTLRQSGMGWGNIGKTLGFKVGPVVSAIRSARATLPEKAATKQLDKPLKSHGQDKPERPDKPDKPEKPEKPQKPEKPDRPGNN